METCWICKKEKGQPSERCSGHYDMPNEILPGEFFYVDNNTSGTISIRRGTVEYNPDDPIVLDFIASANLANLLAHRMNVSHWSIKEPKYAEPTINLLGVPAP